MNDQDIIARINIYNDSNAYEIFIEKYKNFVYKRAYLVCKGNEAEAIKLSTDIFVALYNKIRIQDYTYPLDRWITVEVMKMCRDKLNKN